MRKVTEQVVSAFIDRKSKTVSNTTSTGDALYLHGNKIAWHGKTASGGSCVFLTLCGLTTRTTMERLNGVLSMMGHKSALDGRACIGIGQHKFEPVLRQWSRDDSKRGRKAFDSYSVLQVRWPIDAKGFEAVHEFNRIAEVPA